MKEIVDRISSLPDDVLIHILSYVTTREAVQTCILSKRWRNTWSSVPVLNFGHQYLSLNGTTESWKFERFVNGVLANRERSRLDTVTYHCRLNNRNLEPSMEWLDRVALLMPQVISVNIFGFDEFKCPDSVFSCASLECLTLSLCDTKIEVTEPKSIALPSLKTLELQYSWLDDNLTQNLFLGCPTLETLKLSYCELHISSISSNVLKNLELYECKQFGHVRVSCPGLVSLIILSSKHSIRSISLENTTSLVNADIGLRGIDRSLNGDILPSPKLLNALSNATSLDLYFGQFSVLQERWMEDIYICRTFNNLKSLKIGVLDKTSDFDLIAYFLQLSPVLQQLTIYTWFNMLFVEQKSQGDEERRQQDVCFQREYLETVTIYSWKDMVHKLVTMLGRHVKTIGNIIINE
ncbi:F-box/RNI-like/FBD-like domains-containing protein [Rhynchospora pubera]|uniref:F-box/RNI-like/FBD-like domains-containing protein n=1 Tax=Rhynchospora pubera TaxID=906938 RepID=A0AAV8GIH9_9POAL|nr:F-box/RNI-like/FBD-like domains-containing protein [Rhynchospora pubera]